MRQIQCAQCGRTLVAGEATSVVCPSCGHAAIVPAETLSAALSPSDDSTTRPVPPEIVAAATRAAAQPAPPVPPEQPTLPPPPPADARTMPAYDPPSLPRSRLGGNASSPNTPDTPFTQAATASATASASSSSPAQDATRDLPPEILARAAADPATRPVSSAPVVDEAAVAAARRRRERLTALSGVALLIVLAIGSVGAVMAANGTLNSLLGLGRPAPTATAIPPTPTSAAPAGFRPYTAQDASYQLDVPASWVESHAHSDTVDTSVFIDPATRATLNAETFQASLDPGTEDADFIHIFSTSMEGSFTLSDVKTDSVLLASALWTRETADVAVTSNGQTTTWHVVVLAAQHGQRTFLFAYFAPSAAFSTDDTTYFQPMLQSLKLA